MQYMTTHKTELAQEVVYRNTIPEQRNNHTHTLKHNTLVEAYDCKLCYFLCRQEDNHASVHFANCRSSVGAEVRQHCFYSNTQTPQNSAAFHVWWKEKHFQSKHCVSLEEKFLWTISKYRAELWLCVLGLVSGETKQNETFVRLTSVCLNALK